ncbi:methionine synthase [Cumulibacter soli]|uniref:methionine synthase n=1 Tax=Cumulibacter soli TaxID=2546344 RepID=UPI0010685DA5|nr:methionine synthase [Cumulibacter soli]
MSVATTGVGSLPGTTVRDAIAMPFSEDLQIPYLAELPARGPGADLIGRTAARLLDLPVELHPSAWRLTRRNGIDMRRANDFWSWDLDALQITAAEYAGPLKVALAGPWTLAASLELPNGHRVLTDLGAVRDVRDSLAEGAAALVGEIRRRVPAADVVLQLDEPSLSAVLAGSVPTASGAARIDPVGRHDVGDGIQHVIERAGVAVALHSCAPKVPFTLLRTAGVSGVLFDASLLESDSYDDLGEAVDNGLVLYAGVVPAAITPNPSRIDAWAENARRIADIAGIPAAEVASRIGITSDCGLASASWAAALATTRAMSAVAKKVRDSPEVSDA